MATVPGDPSEPTQIELPEWMKPTMADFLQAASIMHEKGRFQVAGDVVPFQRPTQTYGPGTDWDEISRKNKALATQSVLGRALGRQNVVPIKPEGDK